MAKLNREDPFPPSIVCGSVLLSRIQRFVERVNANPISQSRYL